MSLARAVYAEADVYLLDDPLSAVDAQVGHHLFNSCIKQLLGARGATVVLVTHQLQVVKDCDRCLVLTKSGQVAGLGSAAELTASGIMLSISELQAAPTVAVDGEKVNGGGTVDAKRRPSILRQAEQRQTGKVTRSTYWAYISAGASSYGAFVLLLLFVAAQTNELTCSVVLANWADVATEYPDQLYSNNTVGHNYRDEENEYMVLLGSLVASLVVVSFVRVFMYMKTLMLSSKNVHNSSFSGLFGAPIYFFDSNPVGRILNRFVHQLQSQPEEYTASFYFRFSCWWHGHTDSAVCCEHREMCSV